MSRALLLLTCTLVAACGARPTPPARDAGGLPLECGLLADLEPNDVADSAAVSTVRLSEGLASAATEPGCLTPGDVDVWRVAAAPLPRVLGLSAERAVLGTPASPLEVQWLGSPLVGPATWVAVGPGVAVAAQVRAPDAGVGAYGVTVTAVPLTSGTPTAAERGDAPLADLRAPLRLFALEETALAAVPADCAAVDAGTRWTALALDAGAHALTRFDQPMGLAYSVEVVADRVLARLTERSPGEASFETDGGQVWLGFKPTAVPRCGTGPLPASVLSPVEVLVR